MATMMDVLKAIDESRDGALLAGGVADKLWPGQRFSKPHHGGPDGGQRAAAGLLGRMRRRGLVDSDWRPGDPRTYWRLTQAGRNMLRSSDRADRLAPEKGTA